jgi:hypothetical protein
LKARFLLIVIVWAFLSLILSGAEVIIFPMIGAVVESMGYHLPAWITGAYFLLFTAACIPTGLVVGVFAAVIGGALGMLND